MNHWHVGLRERQFCGTPSRPLGAPFAQRLHSRKAALGGGGAAAAAWRGGDGAHARAEAAPSDGPAAERFAGGGSSGGVTARYMDAAAVAAGARGVPDVLVGLIARRDVEATPAEHQRLTGDAGAGPRCPLAEEQRAAGRGWLSRLPYFIVLVSALEVAVFLWGGAATQMALLYNPHRRLELWRFFSYMLLHADPVHLALNVAIQLLLATPLEYEQGHLRTGLVYLGGGIAGSLGTSMMEPELYIVGASAGVYALLISQLSNILLNFGTIRYKVYRTVAVGVLALTDIAFSLHHHYTFGNVCPRVGLAAHCSGAVAGLLLGLVLFRGQAAKPEDAPWLRACRWTAAVLLGAGFIAAVVCNALLPPVPVRRT